MKNNEKNDENKKLDDSKTAEIGGGYITVGKNNKNEKVFQVRSNVNDDVLIDYLYEKWSSISSMENIGKADRALNSTCKKKDHDKPTQK